METSSFADQLRDRYDAQHALVEKLKADKALQLQAKVQEWLNVYTDRIKGRMIRAVDNGFRSIVIELPKEFSDPRSRFREFAKIVFESQEYGLFVWMYNPWTMGLSLDDKCPRQQDCFQINMSGT